MEKVPNKFTAADLYRLGESKEVERKITELVQQLMQEAVDKTLLLGMEAYSPSLAKLGIDALRPDLISEPSHQEGIALIRYKPTGEAIMFIGVPEWPVGEYSDVSKIRIVVGHEIVKADDRRWLTDRRNGGR